MTNPLHRAALDGVLLALRENSFTFDHEFDLQEGVQSALDKHCIRCAREAPLSPGSRIDFLTPDGIGIEIKAGGSIPLVAEQLLRYAESPQVSALVLVTTRQVHATLPEEISGKPLRVVVVRGGIA